MNAMKLSNKVWQDPVYFIAFGFGSGLMPVAPGTWGTLAAVPIYLLLANCAWGVYITLTLAAFLMGIIVWDEIVGYLLTMFLAPVSVGWMVIGFLLFRLFDIWKPQPIGYVDKKVQGGLGIMLDDVLAAVPAFAVMQLLIWGFA
jgi:phosphatidylglycerophosphatase A